MYRSCASPEIPVRANPLIQLTSILSLPNLSHRCLELTVFINGTLLEDLSVCFPTIVENIFGFTSSLGWGLRALTRQNSPKDAETILKLLGPEGPIIQLAYRLMTDPNLRYEFPLRCLPISVERWISQNEIPYFFPKAITFKYNGGVSPCSMMLNPFEYYFFVYAAIQLGTRSEQNSYLFGWANLTDTVYTNLLETCLEYFLPCNGRGVPPVSLNNFPASDATYVGSSFNQRGNRLSLPETRPHLKMPKLLKSSVLQEDFQSLSSIRELSFSHELSPVDREVWRTETMLSIFIVMWLNVDVGEGLYTCQFETILPSVELVKSVRIIVRHFHYFNNVVTTAVLHPMEEIKKTLFTTFQKKLYSFLRYLFGHWPMDNSFRIVYETWLSYIQPWRYLSHEGGGVVREEVQIDQRWNTFISDNILFYTELFKDMLIRLEKTDLNSFRGAHMLFRTVKIFTSQRILKPTLKSIDNSLFSSESRDLVREILSNLEKAENDAKEFLSDPVNHSQPKKAKNWLSNIFANDESEQTTGATPNKIAEKEKVIAFLESSRGSLAAFFDIAVQPNLCDMGNIHPMGNDIDTYEGTSSHDALLAYGDPGVARKLCYAGNPDLAPIRADENGTVVRILAIIAQLLNTVVGPIIRRKYFDFSFSGSIIRSAFAKPQYYDQIEKHGPGQTKRIQRYLPPRILLRGLGSTSAVLNFLGFVLLGFLFGVQGYGWIGWPILLYMIYIVLRSAFEPIGNLPKLRSDFEGLY